MCQGDCKVQLYDVHFTGTVGNQLIDKNTRQKIDVGGNPCGLGLDATTDALQPYMVKLEGCADKDCICDLNQEDLKWSDWLTYVADVVVDYPAPQGAGGADAICQSTITGYYQVSSATATGVCM